jgi:uncharacterized membrane protein (DUF4010 family)
MCFGFVCIIAKKILGGWLGVCAADFFDSFFNSGDGFFVFRE